MLRDKTVASSSQLVRVGLPPTLAFLTLATVIVGCSDSGSRHRLAGTITFAGQPLEGGWIYFRPLRKGPSTAGEVHNGEFSIPAKQGLPPGTYQVAIEYRKTTGKQVKVYTGEMIDEEKQIIPKRYNEQTTLKAEVTADGSNQFTFELQAD